ncbi:MAG: hypothetical protein ACO3O3_08870 [Ilumatobacteraceae bacterium]
MAGGYAPNDPRKPKKKSGFTLDDFGMSVGDGTVGSGANSGKNPNAVVTEDNYVPTVTRDWDAYLDSLMPTGGTGGGGGVKYGNVNDVLDYASSNAPTFTPLSMPDFNPLAAAIDSGAAQQRAQVQAAFAPLLASLTAKAAAPTQVSQMPIANQQITPELAQFAESQGILPAYLDSVARANADIGASANDVASRNAMVDAALRNSAAMNVDIGQAMQAANLNAASVEELLARLQLEQIKLAAQQSVDKYNAAGGDQAEMNRFNTLMDVMANAVAAGATVDTGRIQ